MRRLFIALATAAMTWVGCMKTTAPALQPTVVPPGASLWQRPADLATRDFYYGPWGRDRAPDPQAIYTLVERKHTGVNQGLTVLDPEGREWSVKQKAPGGLEDESPVEVTLSRLLSGIGYHQPPVYFLPSLTVKDDWGTHVEAGGRFRLKDKAFKEVATWSWQENPFIGTPQYQGLLVLQMMFNSTDMKNSNNSLYEYRDGDLVRHWYMVRDLGAALGDTERLAPIKGDSIVFERQPFIHGVDQNGFVRFAYNGWYRNYVRNRIRPGDVRWASNLLAQLSDRQWQDAFRAGGFAPDDANRFIRKLREKVEYGRNLS